MRIKYQKNLIALIAISFLFVVLRFPSLFEPHWYGDEGIYQVIGRAMNEGRILYQGIWDNKPPFLYIIYALVDGNLFGVKLLSLLFGLASVVFFYFLSNKIFKNNSSRLLSTGIFAYLFGLPIIEGNIANAENFMLLPIIIAANLIFEYAKKRNKKLLLFAGLLLSFAFMTKIVAVFDFLAFSFFLYISQKESVLNFVKSKFIPLAISFISFLLFFTFYFLAAGAIRDFVSSVFLQNVSYVGEENHLFFPMGFLVIKTILLITSIVLLFKFKNKFSIQTIFIYSWVIFSIYSAFFSERPYIHYILVMLPSFSLLVGHLLENKKTKILDAIFICFIMYVSYYHFQTYKKNIMYYRNFIEYVVDGKKPRDYESFFDRSTPLQYAIASFITTNTRKDEEVFLWSDNAQIYALSNKLPIGKYIVAYHITFYKHADVITKQQIERSKPKYIIQTIAIPLETAILSSYQLRYIMDGVKIYERTI